MYSIKSIIIYIFNRFNEGKVQITEMVLCLNLRDLIFHRSAPSYYEVIATFSNQQAVDLRSYRLEVGTYAKRGQIKTS